MNQDAFRSLLGAPAARTGTGRAAGVLGTYAPKRGSGASSSRPEKLSLRKEEPKPAFAPRKVKTDGKYKDRAAMRREGREDEYKPVEQLLEDFERRAKDGNQDAEQVEEQRKYLGGDAEHSILVKGLDFGLLAARKAELAMQDSSKYDAELDDLLESGAKSDVPEESAPRAECSRPKRSRDEIMAELKGRRSNIAGTSVAVSADTALPPSKFRKITAPTFQPVEEKKKKKKKKRVGVTESAAASVEPPAPTTAPSTDLTPPACVATAPRPDLTPTEPNPDPAPAAIPSHRPDELSGLPDQSELAIEPPKDDAESATLETHMPATEEPLAEPAATSAGVEEEDDIFGGVGEYSFHVSDDDSDSDTETGAKQPQPKTVNSERPAEPIVRAKPGKSWFADDAEEEAHKSSSLLDDILKKTSEALPGDARPDRSGSASPEADSAPMRLQPLSTSALPSAKELLALDQEAEKLAKKRASKAKWRAAQGLPAQAKDDDEDYDDEGQRRWDKTDAGKEKQRLNRETQKLQSFMAKKAAH